MASEVYRPAEDNPMNLGDMDAGKGYHGDLKTTEFHRKKEGPLNVLGGMLEGNPLP